MKPMVFPWLLLGLSTGIAQAQRSKPAIARAPATSLSARSEPGVASITFFTAPDGAPVQSAGLDQGTLDLGILSNAPRTDEKQVQIQPQKDLFVAATRVGVRVDLSNSGRGATAMISAYLLSADPQRTVWLDGVQLSQAPGIIARHVSYGETTEHVLKIVIPASAPPGQLLDLIGIIVTPN
jgi:hypothetical protein